MATVSFDHLIQRLQDNVASWHGFLMQQSTFSPSEQRKYDEYLQTFEKQAMEILPVLLRREGTVPVQRMSQLIRNTLRNQGMSRNDQIDIDRLVRYCTDRYAMLLGESHQQSAGMQHIANNTWNAIGLALGRIIPVSVERPKTIKEESQACIVALHELAQHANHTANALMQAGQNIRQRESDIPNSLLQSKRLPRDVKKSSFHTPLVGAMCPTLVALFTTVDPDVYNRFIEADIARVTSNHMRGKPIRSKSDAQLFYDMTTDTHGNAFDTNVYREILARARLQHALKKEVHLLRTGTLDHSSYDFYQTMPINGSFDDDQLFRPPEEVVRNICHALSYFPTVYETLPRTIDYRQRTLQRISHLQSFMPFADSFPSMKNSQQRYPLIPLPTGPEFYTDGSGIYKKNRQVRLCHGPLWVTVPRIQHSPVLKDPNMPSNIEPKPEPAVVVTPMTIPMIVGPLNGIKGARISEDCKRNHPDNKQLRAVVCVKVTSEHKPAGYHCYIASGSRWYRYDPDKLLSVNTSINYFEHVWTRTAKRDWETHGVLFCFS